jgi:hypothetical protein
MINHTNFQNIQLAISAYAQERWTAEKTLNATGIVSTSAEIDASGENFIGQLRWYKPIRAVINNPSLTDATNGAYSTLATDVASYVKNVRAYGLGQVNIQSLITKQDGIARFSAEAAKSRVQDEHEAILAILKGVAASEVGLGAGVDSFDSVPSGTVGAFVDINALGAFGSAATGTGDARKLFDASVVGASRGERLFRAAGMFFKDYEPDYMYMITSPEVLADIRAANLVDEDRVKDGNIEFQTIFGGKFRLVQTRAAQGNLSASANVNDMSTKTTFLAKPGALAFNSFEVPVPVEIDRDAAAYRGGGTTSIWYRYGFIGHPLGYDWAGASNDFATNTTLGTAASWTRKADYLNLGIVPLLHS